MSGARSGGGRGPDLNIESTLNRASFATKLELQAAEPALRRTREAGFAPAEPITLPAARDVDISARRKALQLTKTSTDRVISSFNEAADIARRIAVDRAAAVVELKQDLERISSDLRRDQAVRERRSKAATATATAGTATGTGDDIEGGGYDFDEKQEQEPLLLTSVAAASTTAAKRPAPGTRATSGALLAPGVGRGTGKGTDGKEHVKGSYIAGEFGTPRNDGRDPSWFAPPLDPAEATKLTAAAVASEAADREAFRGFAGLSRADKPRGGSPAPSPSRLEREQAVEQYIQQRTVGNAPRLNNAAGRYSTGVVVHPSLGTTIAPKTLVGTAASDGRVARRRPDVISSIVEGGVDIDIEGSRLDVLLPKKSRAALEAEAAALRAVAGLGSGATTSLAGATGDVENFDDAAADNDAEAGVEVAAGENADATATATIRLDSTGRQALPGRAPGPLAPKLKQQYTSLRDEATALASRAARDKATIRALQQETRPGIHRGSKLLPTPSELVFQDFRVGVPYPLTLKITNIATGFNQLDLLELPDTIRDLFKIAYTPPGRMSPAVSVPITVTFLPRANVDIDSTLTLRSPTGLLAVPIRCRIKRAVPKASLVDDNSYTVAAGNDDSDINNKEEHDDSSVPTVLSSLPPVTALRADFGDDGFYPNGSGKRVYTLRLRNDGALPIVATVKRTGLLAPPPPFSSSEITASAPAGLPLASSPFYLLQSPAALPGQQGASNSSSALLTDAADVSHKTPATASLGRLTSPIDSDIDITTHSFIVRGYSSLSLSLVCVAKEAGEAREGFRIACFEGREGQDSSASLVDGDYKPSEYAFPDNYDSDINGSTAAAAAIGEPRLPLLRVFSVECRVGVQDCPLYLPQRVIHFGSVFAGELYVASLLVRNRAASTFSAVATAGRPLRVLKKKTQPLAITDGNGEALAETTAAEEQEEGDSEAEAEAEVEVALDDNSDVQSAAPLTIEPVSAYIPPKERLQLSSSSSSSATASDVATHGADEVEGLSLLTLKLRIPALKPSDDAAVSHLRIPCRIRATGGGSGSSKCSFSLPFTVEAVVVRPTVSLAFADGLGFDTPHDAAALRRRRKQERAAAGNKQQSQAGAAAVEGKASDDALSAAPASVPAPAPVTIHPRPADDAPLPPLLLCFGEVPSGKCVRRAISISSHSPLPTLYTVTTCPADHPPKHELGLLAAAGPAAASAVWVVEAPSGSDDGDDNDAIGAVPFASTAAVPLQALHLQPFETRTLHLLFRPLCPGGVTGAIQFRCNNGSDHAIDSVTIPWQGVGVAPHLLSSVTRLLLPPLTGDDTALATILLKNVLPASSSAAVVKWRVRTAGDNDNDGNGSQQYRFAMAPSAGVLGPGGEARIVVTATLRDASSSASSSKASEGKEEAKRLFLQAAASSAAAVERFLCGLEVYSSIATPNKQQPNNESKRGDGDDDELAVLGSGALQSLLQAPSSSSTDADADAAEEETTQVQGKAAGEGAKPRPQRMLIPVLASPHPLPRASRKGKVSKAKAAAEGEEAEHQTADGAAAAEHKEQEAEEEEEEDTYNGAFFSCNPVGRLGFGGVNVGGSASRDVTVTNNSRTVPLRVTIAVADPSASAAFTLPVPTLLLPPLSKGLFPVGFSPAEGRRYATALRITALPEAAPVSSGNAAKPSSTSTLAGVQRLLHLSGEGLLPTISFQRLPDCLSDVISAASQAGGLVAPQAVEQAHLLATAARSLNEGIAVFNRDGTLAASKAGGSVVSAGGGTDNGQRLRADFGLMVAGDGAYRCVVLANDSPFPVPFAVRRLPDHHHHHNGTDGGLSSDAWTIADGGAGGLHRLAGHLSGGFPSSSTQWLESESAAAGAGAGIFSVEPREGTVPPGHRVVIRLSADTRPTALRNRLLAACSRSSVALRSSASFLLEVVTSSSSQMALKPLTIAMTALLSDRRAAILPPEASAAGGKTAGSSSSAVNTAIRLRLPGIAGKPSLLYPSMSLGSPLLMQPFLGSKLATTTTSTATSGAGAIPYGRGDGAFPFLYGNNGSAASPAMAPAALLSSLLFNGGSSTGSATGAQQAEARALFSVASSSTSSSSSSSSSLPLLRSRPVVLASELLEVPMHRPSSTTTTAAPDAATAASAVVPLPPAIQLSLACADRLGHRISVASAELVSKAQAAILPALAAAAKHLSAPSAVPASLPASAAASANPAGKPDPKAAAAAKADPKAAAAAASGAAAVPAPTDPASLIPPSALLELGDPSSSASPATQAQACLFVFPQAAPIEDDQSLIEELMKPLPTAPAAPAAPAAPVDPKAKPDPKAAAAAAAAAPPPAAADAAGSKEDPNLLSWRDTVLGALIRGDTAALAALVSPSAPAPGAAGAATGAATGAGAVSALLKATGITDWVSMTADPLPTTALPGTGNGLGPQDDTAAAASQDSAAPASASAAAGGGGKAPAAAAATAAKADPKAAAAAAAVPSPAAAATPAEAKPSFAAVVRDTLKPGTGLCVRFSVPPASIAPQALTPLAIRYLDALKPSIPGVTGASASTGTGNGVMVSEGARKCYGLLILPPTEAVPAALATAQNPAELATVPPAAPAAADPKAAAPAKGKEPAPAAAAPAPAVVDKKAEEPSASTAVGLSLTACPKVIRLCFTVPAP